MGTLNVILITGRTISQGITREGKKRLREYMESAAISEMDPEDLAKLGVKDGDTVRVKTSHGSVVVRAKASTQAPHPGIIFIPLGPWANEIVGSDSDSVGMPTFKSIVAEVEAAPGEQVLTALDIIKRRRG